MTQPIRILHVLGGLDAGGAESFVMNLYRAIDRNAVQFDFVKHTSQIGVFENEVRAMGGEIYQCSRYRGENHWAYKKWWNDFYQQHHEYIVIHGHVRSTAAIYLKIAKKYGRVTIAHSHSTSNGSGISALVKDAMQLPIRHIAEYLFACSDKAGKWLYGSKALNGDNYKIIPNGIDLQRFAFDEDKRLTIRRELGIEHDDYVVGHVGRFSKPKNHMFLIKMFAAFSVFESKTKLLLVGDGPLCDIIQRQCTELGVRDKVIFVGAKTNTEDYYQAMDVFTFPSLWEGLGIVALEAQANGLKCIVSDRVPNNVAVTKKVEFLPLDNMEDWIEAITEEKDRLREGYMEAKDDMLESYNILTIATALQAFYLEKSEKG